MSVLASVRTATAFAPASVGNTAVGFDILGFSFEGPGDRVTAERIERRGVEIAGIRGVVEDLPRAPEANTASVAAKSLLDASDADFGVRLTIAKGIPLGSGMGGSAASAVAAVVATNALLDPPWPVESLYPHALAGEFVASGSAHGDNVAPQLLGGLVLATRRGLVRIPVPESWHAVVVHPDAVLETRRARAALAGSYSLGSFVEQSEHLSLVLAGCFRGDADLVRAGLVDTLVEPRRASLIVGFPDVKAAALDGGAMGASIAGAGPSVFAWFESRAEAERAAPDMVRAFETAGFAAQAYVSPIAGPAARVE